MSMNFTNLQYFVTLAEELNFTRAANRLYISQQALSMHISRLETEYKTTLFVRRTPLRLTESGQRLYLFAKEALAAEKLTRERIACAGDTIQPHLTICTTLSRGNILMPIILPAFQKKCPEVRIEMIQNTSAYIGKLFFDRKADLLLANTLMPRESVVSEFLYNETLALFFTQDCIRDCYPDDWERRVALLEKHCDLKLIEKMRFLKMYDSLALGKDFNDLCRLHGVVPEVYLEMRGIETMVSMCTEGLGAMICPEMFLSFLEHSFARSPEGKLYRFPLGSVLPVRSVSVSYWKQESVPQYILEFVRLAKEAVKRVV